MYGVCFRASVQGALPCMRVHLRGHMSPEAEVLCGKREEEKRSELSDGGHNVGKSNCAKKRRKNLLLAMH